jgi:hypothetical protein
MPMKQHSRTTSRIYPSGESTYRHFDLAVWPAFVEWRTSCVAVLDQVVPKSSLLRKTVDELNGLGNEPSKVEFGVAFLRSVKKELEAGLLDSFARQVEAEVLSDFLDQAMAALANVGDEPNYIAAAIIAGASLERSLRAVCVSLLPEEPTTKANGSPLGMAALIESLKKRQVVTELQAKELRAWAALRNHAAHGEFDAFDRSQADSMVGGIVRFVTEFSK